MDANTTTSLQSEPDQDNSSLQNPSTNAAEAGTTDETRDEEHETSSIEALNWSEVEEEELAAAQKAEALATDAAAATTQVAEGGDEKSSETNNDSSTVSSTVHVSDEGNVLSTSLLQSINSSTYDEDSQARKLSVIETWASEVSDAVERGEIDMTEFGGTGDDEDEAGEDVNKEGMRKRRGRWVSPDMGSGITSSASNAESSVDPLSNAPVLDDGPIWNKGPRSYTFQENRRINQKLTFILLFSVVLALGLGLGNLVAHQECEAEFKASQQSQLKTSDKVPITSGVPVTTTPAPIIAELSTDSSMNSVPTKRIPQGKKDESDEIVKRYAQPVGDKKRDEPIIDAKYRAHAETVSSVVHTIDKLSRQIDMFENNTRKIQGVLMIPDESDEERSTETPPIYDEQVHVDSDAAGLMTMGEEEDEEQENEKAIIEDLIDAIEQTPNYLEKKRLENNIEEYDKTDEEANLGRPSLFSRKIPISDEELRDIEIIKKSILQFKDFEHRFVKSERKKLIEEGKFSRFAWREPEDYSDEEKAALRARHKSSWDEFLKLVKDKTVDPIEALFGAEEEIEERTYGDVFHYPWPDPEENLNDEEYQEEFKKNLAELRGFEKSSGGGFPDEISKHETADPPVIEIEAEFPEPPAQHPEPNDDLIILEHKPLVENVAAPEPTLETQHQTYVQQAWNEDHGKSKSADEVVSGDPSSSDSSQLATSSTFINSSDKSEHNTVEKVQSTSETTTSSPPPSFKKTRRDTSAKHSASKSKKSGNKSTNDVTNISNDNNQQQPQSGKQKEQKAKKQKGKGNKVVDGSASSTALSSGNKGKVSSKGKKQKSVESNKVFENVQGKNTDKRRSTVSAEGRGKDVHHSADKSGESNRRRGGKKAAKENSNASMKQSTNNNRNSGPKYYDSRDIKEQQEGRNSGNDNRATDKSASRSKSGNQDFSSKETQYRQQKQEFNSNHESRNHNSGKPGKKSKNYNSKQKADRDKERKTSWGN